MPEATCFQGDRSSSAYSSQETSGADLSITQTKNEDQELVFREHEGFDIKAVLTLS